MLSQSEIEQMFNKRQLLSKIIEDFDGIDDYKDYRKKAKARIRALVDGVYYPSKDRRMDSLSMLINCPDEQDTDKLIDRILATICLVQAPTPIVSVAGMLAEKLGMEHKRDSLYTALEIIAVCRDIGWYIVGRRDNYSQYMMKSNLQFDDNTVEEVSLYMYLPPMVEAPATIMHNSQSPYQTLAFDSCLSGASDGFHTNDICLDVLNLQNRIEYKIDTQFFEVFPEQCAVGPEHPDYAQELANHFKKMKQTQLALDVIEGRNVFIPNKYDGRGRLYAQGYHISPQGNEFAKAILDLKNSCTVEVPTEFL